MTEAVRTMASPAATWVIAVMATILALFMASAAMFADRREARAQRRERRLGMAPELGPAGTQWPRLTQATMWPRMSEALLAAAGVPQSAAAQIRAGVPAGVTAAGHDIPAQRAPAEQRAAAKLAADAAQAESPTEPIPVASAQGSQGVRDMQYASGGRDERADDGPAGEMPTRPDLLGQGAPGRRAVPMPAQRTGESDRAERSFAGPAPQDEDEDEQ